MGVFVNDIPPELAAERLRSDAPGSATARENDS
jgi:hypothetical protein